MPEPILLGRKLWHEYVFPQIIFNMATSHGAQLKFVKEQLQKNKQQLYHETHKTVHVNMQLVQAIKNNISNLEKEIEQYDRRDYFQDVRIHQMPPPPAPTN